MFQGFYAKQLSKIGLSENIIGVIAGYFLQEFNYLLSLLFFFAYFEVIIKKDNFLWGIFLEFFVSKIWKTNILNFQVKKTHLWKKKVISIQKEKKCMLQFNYCNSFRPRSGHTPNEFAFTMIWLTCQRIDWYFSENTNQIQDNITFQMPKRRKLTGI